MKVHETTACRIISTSTSPSKSEYSENALVYDTVEIAAIKQRMIAAKITPSISQTPIVSPMKLASNCSIGNKRGYVMKNGAYRKIHRCRFCPYMNLRARNLRLHELMHGRRQSSHTLTKCPHCNYFVGSKGLLAHHLKVHQPNYGLELQGAVEGDRVDDGASEGSDRSEYQIPYEKKVDTLLEIARFKKYGCEKCPYSSAKRAHFERHVELHGSRQKCVCVFCDYSVPSQNLLSQHVRLHLEPNQNLLAAQSIGNLQHLPEMPADVALSGMMTNMDVNQPVSVTHDHIDLYENTPEDSQPKKVYRCDRCPYANTRRDHLLAHLRCHMIKNEYACPYCDYSVAKTHVLVQHVKVHFSPLPELSDWLAQNGQIDRVKETKDAVLKEAIQVAQMYQSDEKKTLSMSRVASASSIKSSSASSVTSASVVDESKKTESEPGPSTMVIDDKIEENIQHDAIDDEVSFKVKSNTSSESLLKSTTSTTNDGRNGEPQPGSSGHLPATTNLKENNDQVTDADKETGDDVGSNKSDSYVCQYCDREFTLSDHLVWHEMQHLIGNNFEDLLGKVKPANSGQKNPGKTEQVIKSVRSISTVNIETPRLDIQDKQQTDGDIPVNQTPVSGSKDDQEGQGQTPSVSLAGDGQTAVSLAGDGPKLMEADSGPTPMEVD